MQNFNFRQINGTSLFRPWKQWEVSDYLVGKYISEGQDKFGNPSYKVEVIETNFSTNPPPSGSLFTLNSSGSLNKSFEEIQPGQIVKVIYKGLDTVKKGKYADKEFHKMEVLVAPANGSAPVSTSSDEDLI